MQIFLLVSLVCAEKIALEVWGVMVRNNIKIHPQSCSITTACHRHYEELSLGATTTETPRSLPVDWHFSGCLIEICLVKCPLLHKTALQD